VLRLAFAAHSWLFPCFAKRYQLRTPFGGWLLTVGNPLMDCRIRQTATASPAEPGGLPMTLANHDERRQRVADEHKYANVVTTEVQWNGIENVRR
jgi:hypothetical protein